MSNEDQISKLRMELRTRFGTLVRRLNELEQSLKCLHGLTSQVGPHADQIDLFLRLLKPAFEERDRCVDWFKRSAAAVGINDYESLMCELLAEQRKCA